jgi:hypothetical protein
MTSLRRSAARAVTAAFLLILVGCLLLAPRDAAVGVEPEPAADSPDQYIWRLVYRIETKPEGETVAVPNSKPHQIKVLYTFVKEFQVRADGTFAFEECDFGHCRQEDVQEVGKVKLHSRTNWQGLLRGSGKWQPATREADETLSLKLEWGAGNGANEMQTEGGSITPGVKYAVSPDGRTVTTTTEPPGGKPIRYSYPNSFVDSEWTLESNQAVPDGGRGAIRGRKLKVFPVSFLNAEEDECEDQEDEFSGERSTTLICEGGPRTPVRETVEVKKAKKEADLAVRFSGGEESHPQRGSTGTVKAIVSNNGPCEVHATLELRVLAGSGLIASDEYGDSHVQVLSYTDGFSEATMERSADWDEYNFTYQFTLPRGGARLVEIEGKDTTPPGQTLPYIILFRADVTGDVPDPNGGNNVTHREVTFDPPK